MKKRWSVFTIIMLCYIGVMLIATLIVDDSLWTRLERFEETEKVKEEEQKRKIEEKAEEARLLAEQMKPTPTPTPAPIIKERIRIVKPAEDVLYVNGEAYDDQVTWTEEVDKETFGELLSIEKQYSEYADVLAEAIPKLESCLLVVEKGTSICFLDCDGTMVTPNEGTTLIDVDGEMRTIRELRCPYNNRYSGYEEMTSIGFDFLTKFCLFCSNDKSAYEMKNFFPNNSQYYKDIASLDNSWFNGHSKPPTYTNHTVKEYYGYGDSLVYMDLRMDQSFVASYTGQRFDTEIVHPIWFVKIGEEWKVASIVFSAGETE